MSERITEAGPESNAKAAHGPGEGRTIYLVDRSGAETDDKCGMAYWLNRKEGPARRGLVPKGESIHLEIGRQTHEDMAALAEMDDLTPPALQRLCDDLMAGLTADHRQDRKKMEMLYRRMGWLVAWALFREPMIRQRYENVGIERELVLDRTPLWIAVTPDRVVRDRVNNYLVYLEYKTTISASQKWLDSWRYQIQLHTSMAAVEEEAIEEPLKFAHVIGLMKGQVVEGRLRHPYVWAYKNTRTNEWTHDYQKARSGEWEPAPVWDFPLGIVEWVQRCGEEVAASQFPMTAPIFLNIRLLNEWIDRRIFREEEIASVAEKCYDDLTLRSRYFPRHTNRCKPGFGDACPYLKICWNAESARNPSADPDYEERVPHHDLEIVGVN
jgi:hypothetical protein